MKHSIKSLSTIIIFTGSVFLTSSNFVDRTNSSKFFFVLVSSFLAITIISVSKKRVRFDFLSKKVIFWSIITVCVLQAYYGLSQYLSWLPSNDSRFAITGSFDNPAGFAAVLSIGFPIGLYLLVKAKKVERYLIGIALVIIAMAVFLSGSRTGILAILISSLAFSLLQAKNISKFLELRYSKLLSILILILLVSGAFILYSQKKDSANGRLLIWKVSSEMIKDKPILGHGYGSFQEKYMDYQAEYFKNNPNSKYSQLADNVKHPFNEFVKVAIEFGLVGLLIILSIISFFLWKIIRSKNAIRSLFLSGLVSFLVFACFSYPLQYVAVWLLLAFYLSAILPVKDIEIKNTFISITVRCTIIIVCVFFLFQTYDQIHSEIKWKTIAMNSLQGKTEAMLPEYEKLYNESLKRNSLFLYNYGAELNFSGRFDKSNDVLTECKKHFNDYDLQMLLADNYYKIGKAEKAIQIYEHASIMIPCRFLPLFKLFEIYKKEGQKDLAQKIANKIINKKPKILSSSVTFIKSEAKEYLHKTSL